MAAHLTAGQIHQYDQAHAERTRQLDILTAMLADSRAVRPDTCAVIGLAAHLVAVYEQHECAEMLACAIERLARITPPGDTDGESPPAGRHGT